MFFLVKACKWVVKWDKIILYVDMHMRRANPGDGGGKVPKGVCCPHDFYRFFLILKVLLLVYWTRVSVFSLIDLTF